MRLVWISNDARQAVYKVFTLRFSLSMASRFNLARSSSVSGIMGGGSIFSIKIIIQNPSWKGKSSRCVWFQFRMSGGGANVLKSVPLGDGCLPRVIRRSGQIEHFEIAGSGEYSNHGDRDGKPHPQGICLPACGRQRASKRSGTGDPHRT